MRTSFLAHRRARPTRPRRPRRPRVEALEGRALLTAGALDTTFGGTGTVLASINSETGAQAVAIQYDSANDLKTVVVGTAVIPVRNEYQPVQAVIRYNIDGTIDTTFGSGGEVNIAYSGLTSSLPYNTPDVALQAQSDGKIVIAGGIYVTYGTGKNAVTREDILVVRLNPDGSLDTTFNGTGKATLDIPAKGSIDAGGLAILSTGQIVVGGSTTSRTGFLAARWNANGTLDTTFGPNGQGYVATSTGGAKLVSGDEMTLDAMGNILIAGSDRVSGVQYAAVVRFTAAGLPDATFGNQGEALFNPPNPRDPAAYGVGVQSTGQVVVGGLWTLYTPVFGIARLNADGALDTLFGSGGYFTLPSGTADAVDVQPDDKILVSGSPGSLNGFAVDRILADGSSFDSTFGNGGQATATFSNSTSAAAPAMALGPDGKITVAGFAHISNSYLFGVARFLNDITSNTTMTTGAAPASTAIMALTPDLIASALDSPDLRGALHPLPKRLGAD